MKFCSNCGFKMEDADVFCMNCGTKSENNVVESVNNKRKESAIGRNKIEECSPEIKTNLEKNSKRQVESLKLAQYILFQQISLPDYKEAMAHVIRAKKSGVLESEITPLVLACQLYKTLAWLKQLYAIDLPRSINNIRDSNVLNQVQTSNKISSDSSGSSQNSTGNYIKSAVAGAVAGAITHTITNAVLGTDKSTAAHKGYFTQASDTTDEANWDNANVQRLLTKKQKEETFESDDYSLENNKELPVEDVISTGDSGDKFMELKAADDEIEMSSVFKPEENFENNAIEEDVEEDGVEEDVDEDDVDEEEDDDDDESVLDLF